MIDPNSIPEVALNSLNKDHYAVVELVNQLDSHLRLNAAQTELASVLSCLIEHLENHFACEERQMNKYRFPAYPIHQSEHKRVLTEIKQVAANLEGQQLQRYLNVTFCPWLVEHIATLDTITARYIVNAGGS
jgi:hemerythrin